MPLILPFWGQCAALREGFAGSLRALCQCTEDFIVQESYDLKPGLPTWFLSSNYGNITVLSFHLLILLLKLCRNLGGEKGCHSLASLRPTVSIHLYDTF